MAKRSRLETYKDGFVARFHNRRISMVQESETKSVNIRMDYATEDFEKPACLHTANRGIRTTEIKLSEEAMERLMIAWIEYKRHKNK